MVEESDEQSRENVSQKHEQDNLVDIVFQGAGKIQHEDSRNDVSHFQAHVRISKNSVALGQLPLELVVLCKYPARQQPRGHADASK